jgi:protease-4
MWTRNKDYNRNEWARFQAWLDRVYEDFTGKVAEGRCLPMEKVLEIAKGRVWSGEDARDLGLVDALGGFPTALRLAKEGAGIPDDEEVRLKSFPRKKSIWKALLGRDADSSEREAVSMTALRILEVMQPVAEEIRKMGFTGEYDVLRMPDPSFGE